MRPLGLHRSINNLSSSIQHVSSSRARLCYPHRACSYALHRNEQRLLGVSDLVSLRLGHSSSVCINSTPLLTKSSSKTASTYASEPWQKDLINKTHAFLLAHLSWLGVDFIDPSTAFEALDGPPHGSASQVRVLVSPPHAVQSVTGSPSFGTYFRSLGRSQYQLPLWLGSQTRPR